MDINSLPLYVISIDSARLKYQEKVFAYHGVKQPVLIEGIKTPDDYSIGCMDSHIKALNAYIKSNESWGIIFEDDAYPVNDVVNKFAKLTEKLPDDLGLLALGDIWSYYIKLQNFRLKRLKKNLDLEPVKAELNKGEFTALSSTFPNPGSQAYLVKREMAELLLNKLIPKYSKIRLTSDSMLTQANLVNLPLKSYANFRHPLFLQHTLGFEDGEWRTNRRINRLKRINPDKNLCLSMYYYFYPEEVDKDVINPIKFL